MPGVTWWKLTNSIMVRRAERKPTFARPAASVSLGSKQSFAAAIPKVYYADFPDIGFPTFVHAALYRICCDHFAATQPKSRKRS